MAKKHRSKGLATLQKHLLNLPLELIQLILEEVARQAPHLGAWMLRTNATLKRWIEPVLYHTIKIGSQPYQGTDAKCLDAFLSRDPSFYTQRVEVLSFGYYTRPRFVLPFLEACTGAKSLDLHCTFYAYYFTSTEEKGNFLDSYFKILDSTSLRPTRLVIDMYEHMTNFPTLNATHPLFSNVTHLELECHPDNSFINEHLLTLTRVIRFKVYLLAAYRARPGAETLLSAVNTITKFCPPNARICLIWCNDTPLEELISSPPLSRITKGSLGNKVVLGAKMQEKEKEMLDRPGYRSILSNWCLERSDLPSIWTQAEEIVGKRLNSEAKVMGLLARFNLGS